MKKTVTASIDNATLVSCGKKCNPIMQDPNYLLKNNYLGEFRTETEKAIARKNLGIDSILEILKEALEDSETILLKGDTILEVKVSKLNNAILILLDGLLVDLTNYYTKKLIDDKVSLIGKDLFSVKDNTLFIKHG